MIRLWNSTKEFKTLELNAMTRVSVVYRKRCLLIVKNALHAISVQVGGVADIEEFQISITIITMKFISIH